MRPTTGTRRFIVGVAIALAATSTGVGAAQASTFHPNPQGNSQYSQNKCHGLSPNFVDIPYVGTMRVMQYYRLGRGIADIGVTTNPSIWGYDTLLTVKWTNLNTRRWGMLRGVSRTSIAGKMHYFSNVRTGVGKVRIELRPTNRGVLATVPASVCSDVFTIK